MFKKYLGIALLIVLIGLAFFTKKNDEATLSSSGAQINYIERENYQCITYDGVIRRVVGRYAHLGIVRSDFNLIEYDLKGNPKDISVYLLINKCFYAQSESLPRENNVGSGGSNGSNGSNNGSSGNNGGNSEIDKAKAAKEKAGSLCDRYRETLNAIPGSVVSNNFLREELTIHIDGNKIYYNREDISKKTTAGNSTGFVEIGSDPTMDVIVKEVIRATKNTQKICFEEKPTLKINAAGVGASCKLSNGVELKNHHSMKLYSNKVDPCTEPCSGIVVVCSNGSLRYAKDASLEEFDRLSCVCPKK